MNRWVNSAIFAIVGSCVLAPPVGAQPLPGMLGQNGRPAFSPYLNLTRPGGTPALNYFGMVQPQTQFRQSFQNLQGAVNFNQQAISNVQAGELPATGHAVGFMNYNSYFMTMGTSVNRGSTRFSGGQFRTPSPGTTGPMPGGGVRSDVRR